MDESSFYDEVNYSWNDYYFWDEDKEIYLENGSD